MECKSVARITRRSAIGTEKVVGFISGYIPPRTPNTLFVWQVAISEKARGKGLASQLVAQQLKQAREHKQEPNTRAIKIKDCAS
ncbi:MAG: GNAT family N-acetyltransferase [Marinagarivorans sp.]|nr:GNAT family N-acetyltransferase [Marinagarivorans sp.]